MEGEVDELQAARLREGPVLKSGLQLRLAADAHVDELDPAVLLEKSKHVRNGGLDVMAEAPGGLFDAHDPQGAHPRSMAPERSTPSPS
jgi:hypothetical protein